MSLFGSSVEYGLHCLTYLVKPPAGQPVGAKDLAELQGVSPSLVAKVFTQLQKAGIVESAEGVRGGFRLSRPAAEITVLDVVDAIEGDKPLFTCRQILGQCAVLDCDQAAKAARGMCMIHAVMLEAEQSMRRTLRSYTLADMAHGVTASMPPRFMQNVEAWFADRLTQRGRGGEAAAAINGFVPSSALTRDERKKELTNESKSGRAKHRAAPDAAT